MNSLAVNKSLLYTLTAETSPSLQGTEFRVSQTRITIGRDSSNNICLDDDVRVSRRHALITSSSSDFFIENLTENNFLFVNGIKTKKSKLNSMDLITVGKSTFRFQVPSLQSVSDQPLGHTKSQENSPGTNSKKKLIIYATIGIVLLFVLNQYLSKSSSSLPSQTPSKVELMTEKTSSLKQQLSTIKKNKPSRSATRVNALYQKGFRDYQKGQFYRAIYSFNAALSLDPTHEKSLKYKQLSKDKSNERMNLQERQARLYKENGQYKYCYQTLNALLSQVSDVNSERYKKISLDKDICYQKHLESYL